MNMSRGIPSIIDLAALPEHWPAHLLPAGFLASMARAVATFGFLEEVLVRAIVSLTGSVSTNGSEAEIKTQAGKWLAEMKTMQTEQLGGLIKRFAKAMADHPATPFPAQSQRELVERLDILRKQRNTICHASWGKQNEDGGFRPFDNQWPQHVPEFVNSDWLDGLQKATMEQACAVINSVTLMGFPFLGTGR